MTRIAVLGGGPAGLYFAYRWKSRHPADRVAVFEQNPEGATFGFGVVFSDRAMDFLRADDPETAEAITVGMETWQDITLVHRGERIAVDGVGFSAIGRLDLLNLLAARARSAGVELRFGARLDSLANLDADLIIGADGVNSLVRSAHAREFGATLSHHSEKFAWFGTTKPFETLTQTFVANEWGNFNAHHYRYDAAMSTFIVECDPASWQRAGFDHLDAADSKTRCEQIFAATLDGRRLIDNKSTWRNFPWIRNERWSHGNMVLVGDALHTAHYSVGSGTRLALEDVLALTRALEAHPGDTHTAFAAYEVARRPVAEKIAQASRDSAEWYADFPTHMALAPLDFAHSYITRSGRVDDDRLRRMSPRFMARYDAARTVVSGKPR